MKEYEQLDRELKAGRITEGEYVFLVGEITRIYADKYRIFLEKELDRLEREVDDLITVSEIWKIKEHQADVCRTMLSTPMIRGTQERSPVE